MASINISDLRPAGSDLFFDSETYMNEISEGEITSIQGGTNANLSWAISGYLTGKIVDKVAEWIVNQPNLDSKQCETFVVGP